MNKSLMIIGAGDHDQIAYETAEAMEIFEKIDFLDDNSGLLLARLVILKGLQESIPLELWQLAIQK